jgi:hypothetical protein
MKCSACRGALQGFERARLAAWVGAAVCGQLALLAALKVAVPFAGAFQRRGGEHFFLS